MNERRTEKARVTPSPYSGAPGDLFAISASALQTPLEPTVLTVAALSRQLKTQIETRFASVRVRGEISSLKRHSSGHIYFSLKDPDQEAVLNAICWRGTQTSVTLEEGLEIIATGRLTTYSARSNYQIIVSDAQAAGEGALLKVLQERKQRLEAEGLFAKHRPLPRFPKRIGVITSPTGAVIRDILHRVSARFPCHILVWPVAVQGKDSAEQIATAVRGMNALTQNKPDLLIVARGGGSLEDLWSFNEEVVVRAVFESALPVISAVGHETDTTLIDYAADCRAPTPTAAAELATPVREDLQAFLKEERGRLKRGLLQRVDRASLLLQKTRLPRAEALIEERSQRLDGLFDRFLRGLQVAQAQQAQKLATHVGRLLPPQALFQTAALRIDIARRTMTRQMEGLLSLLSQKVEGLSTRLQQGSYEALLKKGFCLAMKEDGAPLTSASAVRQQPSGEAMMLRFFDGTVTVSTRPLDT